MRERLEVVFDFFSFFFSSSFTPQMFTHLNTEITSLCLFAGGGGGGDVVVFS